MIEIDDKASRDDLAQRLLEEIKYRDKLYFALQSISCNLSLAIVWVISKSRSDNVDFPWSMCAMIAKFRIFFWLCIGTIVAYLLQRSKKLSWLLSFPKLPFR